MHLIFTSFFFLCSRSENFFFFSSRRRHTISFGDWSSDVCSSDPKSREPWLPSTCAGDLRGLLRVALRSQGNWRWEGPLGTPLGLVHWKRASSPVEAGSSGFL